MRVGNGLRLPDLIPRFVDQVAFLRARRRAIIETLDFKRHHRELFTPALSKDKSTGMKTGETGSRRFSKKSRDLLVGYVVFRNYRLGGSRPSLSLSQRVPLRTSRREV